VVRASKSASTAAGASSRDVILDAARTLIASKGYDGMAVSDLCAQSGLPASSIYYHFGNKLGVLAALLERTFDELHALFPNPSSFDDREPIDRLEAWFTAACRSLDRRPDYLRLLLAVSVGPHKDSETVRSTCVASATTPTRPGSTPSPPSSRRAGTRTARRSSISWLCSDER
jgi:AcrR family transcriptional regulator